ncbi:hypothetical protein [Mycolicibacterium vanbaalenii]|uniref:hypothetical protein n=1 Tax=Mycolicibacterium vanbaalenii TaxID=110539 RepID=UPI001F15CCD4|nr:hypothetical protein [Mycolicibacterium vanbaalenii]
MPPQLGKYDVLDVAQRLFELVSGVCGDDDEVLEVEVSAGRVGEPAQQDGSGVDPHSIAEHNRCAAVDFSDAGELIVTDVHRDSLLSDLR